MIVVIVLIVLLVLLLLPQTLLVIHISRRLKKRPAAVEVDALTDALTESSPEPAGTPAHLLRHEHRFGEKDVDGVRTCRCGDRYLDGIRRS